MGKLPHKHGYPGDGYYQVICDICGKKMRAKDAHLITDKASTNRNLLVCAADRDMTNPQEYIRAFADKQLKQPRFIRSEGTDQFVTPTSGRNPGAPRHLEVISALAGAVELVWQGPEDSGSGAISGYKIERESPVGGGFSTLVADTQSVAGYYKDTATSASTQYNYRVSAINHNGTGSASNETSVTASST